LLSRDFAATPSYYNHKHDEPWLLARGMATANTLDKLIADLDRIFLVEEEEPWSVRRLLSLAADVDRDLPDDAGEMVAIRSGSAAFILASLLGLWKSRRCGVLIDPTIKGEMVSIEGGAGRTLIVPTEEATGIASEVAIAESGGKPLTPRLPDPTEPSVAFFTSGSTGAPKLIPKKNYQFLHQLEAELDWLEIGGRYEVLCLSPAHHILGFVWGLFFAAATGGTATFLSSPTPQAWLRGIRKLNPSLVIAVPSHYRVLGQTIDSPLPRAEYICSGAPLPFRVQRSFEEKSGSPIVQIYGSTETGGVARSLPDGTWVPLPGLRWRTDEEHRLWVSSSWQEDPEGWERTDDLAEATEEGFRLLGRADTIVKIGAKRFSTEEIVRAARAIPGVDDAAAVTYERYGETAIALFAVPSAGESLDRAEIAGFLGERLASFKLPRTIRLIDKLPAIGIGKVDSEKLRKLIEAG
jgi:acyl-coenzyme A synthetase/AMP-(fatty) acid ligase